MKFAKANEIPPVYMRKDLDHFLHIWANEDVE